MPRKACFARNLGKETVLLRKTGIVPKEENPGKKNLASQEFTHKQKAWGKESFPSEKF